MSNQHLNLDPRQYLAALLENLNSRFYADERLKTKGLYNALIDQEDVHFMQIGSLGSGEISCWLTLDHSQYSGKLSYGKFRECLATMMRRIAVKLSNKEDLNVMVDETGDMVFNIPGVVESDGEINVLINGLSQTESGKAVVCLMFIESTGTR